MKKIATPICILIAAAFIVHYIFSSPPELQKGRGPKVAKILVETLTVMRQPYAVWVKSYGNVRPQIQSQLVAQVSGQIIEVNDLFRNGCFFKKGDVLLQLDDRDHKVNVKMAESNLVLAQQDFVEEKARGQQAKEDWHRLNRGSKEKPNELVLRLPQLKAAKAKVISAEAQLQKAKLDLERTKIKAPYNGRILSKHVDVGQVVSVNYLLADIYAIDHVEVRLPIKNRDLPYIKFPESEGKVTALLKSNLVGEQKWQASIERTEGVINDRSQQLYVVARIDRPFEEKDKGDSIKVGQYVTASIEGKTIAGAIVIPNQCIYQGSYVYVEKEGVIERRSIEIAWQNNEEAMIVKGLFDGDRLVVTPLGRVSSGTPVTIKGEKEKEKTP